MKTKIIVAGAAGRMGKQLVTAVNDTPQAILAGALERTQHPDIGRDAGLCAGVGSLGVSIQDRIAKENFAQAILIDFTQPDATIAHLQIAAASGAKAVVGTTGFTPSQMQEIDRLSESMAIVLAPNMSIGMNLLFKLSKDVAQILGSTYDAEIIEAHHRFKKDAPSGSAKRLAEKVAEGLGRDLQAVGIYGRHGIVGERKPEEIGVHAVRAGDIVGDHIVLFGGMGERIELRHMAHSRETFARGAVRAALWLSEKACGQYDMQDVLGLK